jgi:hypothetical protein
MVFIGSSVGAYANIVYTIVNDVVDQNGHDLIGTITTDGTLGTINASNIVAWSYTVTGPNGFTANSTDPGATIAMSSITAVGNELLVPSEGLGLDNLTLGEEVIWGPGQPSYLGEHNGVANLWDASPPVGFPPSPPWDVANARVSEPSSLMLLSAAAACGFVGRLLRRRRSRASAV